MPSSWARRSSAPTPSPTPAFRGSIVPRRPISYIDVQREWQLWSLLDESCNAAGRGCEALAILHNANISNGRMFSVDDPGAAARAHPGSRSSPAGIPARRRPRAASSNASR